LALGLMKAGSTIQCAECKNRFGKYSDVARDMTCACGKKLCGVALRLPSNKVKIGRGDAPPVVAKKKNKKSSKAASLEEKDGTGVGGTEDLTSPSFSRCGIGSDSDDTDGGRNGQKGRKMGR